MTSLPLLALAYALFLLAYASQQRPSAAPSSTPEPDETARPLTPLALPPAFRARERDDDEAAPAADASTAAAPPSLSPSPAVAALRRACERRHNGGAPLPAALDSDVWLARLLARDGRDAAWAERKVAGALAWRREVAGGGFTAGGAGSDDALLGTPALARAGGVLSVGCLYWRGLDARGRPVLWARSGLLDFSRGGDAGKWASAIATVLEVSARARSAAGIRGCERASCARKVA